MEKNQRKKIKRIETTFKNGRFRFAIYCLNQVMEDNPNKNFVFSPPCIYEALFLTFHLITGEIKERLKNILSLKKISKLDLQNYCQYKMKSKEESDELEDPSYHYNVRCWNKYEINYTDDVLLYLFHAPIISLDMSQDSESKIKYVNRVINRTVKDYIRYPVKLSAAGQEKDFILLTSICYQFYNLAIREADLENIPTSNASQIINYYYKDLSMHVSDIPYKKGNISLFVFTPASLIKGKWKIKRNISNTDLLALTNRLSDSDGINKLRKLLKNSRTMNLEHVTSSSVFSCFEIEKDLTIRELLRALDIEELLTSEKIYLDIPYKDGKNRPEVHIKNAVHRARVKVTEDKIVAGAMSLIHTGKEFSPLTKKIDVNCKKPFIWLIYNTKQEEIQLVGTCNSAEPNCHIVPMDIDEECRTDEPQMKKMRFAEAVVSPPDVLFWARGNAPNE